MPKYTKGGAKSAPLSPENIGVKPVNYTTDEFIPSSPAVAAFEASTRPGNLRLLTQATVTRTVAAAKPSKRGKKGRQPSGADPSGYNRNKSSPPGHPYALLESNRERNRQVADFLKTRAYSLDDPLLKVRKKLLTCSVYGAFLELPSKAANKVGQAMCKSRVCPTCQRALSVKRKDALGAFVKENKEALKGYRFYHMVLTLRHSKELGVRTDFYFSDLLQYFKELRGVTGKATRQRKWWDQRVAGGFYSVEVTGSKDGTAHIHLHIMLAAKMPLWRSDRTSEFLKEVRLWWLKKTGEQDVNAASSQVHVEPVFTWRLDENGEHVLDKNGDKEKDYATVLSFEGSEAEQDEAAKHLDAAIAECAKYTMKADAQALAPFSDEMLRELVLTRHRYYGRFGCFHSKSAEASKFKNLDRLNADFQDLSDMDAKRAAQLWCPIEKRQVARYETRTVVTHFANCIPLQTPGSAVGKRGNWRGFENYWQFIDRTKLIEYTEAATLGRELAKTIYKRYDKGTDLLPPVEAVGGGSTRPEPAPPAWTARNYFRYQDAAEKEAAERRLAGVLPGK